MEDKPQSKAGVSPEEADRVVEYERLVNEELERTAMANYGFSSVGGDNSGCSNAPNVGSLRMRVAWSGLLATMTDPSRRNTNLARSCSASSRA